jgi:DNA adenine methylase
VKYNERIFSWDDQLRLARHALALSRRGCHVVVSNADHPSVRSLYTQFRMVRLWRFSRIAATSEHRREVSEVVFIR